MLLVLEMAVEVKMEKTDCFVKNEIFSVFDGIEHAFSPFIYRIMKDYFTVEL